MCGGTPVVGFLHPLPGGPHRPLGSQNKSSHGTTALGAPAQGSTARGTTSFQAPTFLRCRDRTAARRAPPTASASLRRWRRRAGALLGCLGAQSRAPQLGLSCASPHGGRGCRSTPLPGGLPRPHMGQSSPPRPESASAAAPSPTEGEAPCGRALLSLAQPRAETAR